MKIVILSPNRKGVFSSEHEARLRAHGELIFVEALKPVSAIPELLSADEKILALDPDFVSWNFTKDDIDLIPNLKAICLQTTSFGWVDTAHAATKNIPVTNLRGFPTEAVAEYAVFMMLGVIRKLPLVMKDGFKQDFAKHQGIELMGKRVGIVGLGSISTRFAEICQSLGMEVVYWSRKSRDPRFIEMSLQELFKTSDIILPGLAQNEETKPIINEELICSMKPAASFISIVHKVYQHELLLSLVKDGKLLGYAF